MARTLKRLKQKRSRSLSKEVYDALRKSIIRGELKPNQRLIEENLAAEMGASRTPIREAIQKLESENLVTKMPKGGFVVKPITVREIHEIFGIRSVLESYAAYLTTENLTEKTFKQLEKAVENFDQALEKGDMEKLIKYNTIYHDLLYKSSGSKILYEMINRLWDYFYRYRRVMLEVTETAEISSREHRAMLLAMRQGDSHRVETLVRKHIIRGRDILVQEIKTGRVTL